MNRIQKNILFGVAHETVWGISFALIDPVTTLQLTLNDLGGSAELAGLLGGLLFALANAPQMLSAFMFSPRWSDPRWCASLHLPALAFTALLAGLFLLFPGMDPALKLRFFLLLTAGFFVMLGLVVPHWITLISRCIPDGIRGRYFAWCFSLANLGGALSGALAAHWISQGGLAWGYGRSFAWAFILQLVSVALLPLMVPLESRPTAPGKLREFLKKQWQTVTGHPGFTALAIVFILMQFCGAPFYLFTDYLKGKGLPTSWWELFNASKNVGGVLGSFIIGYLADHYSPRKGLYLAFAVMALALVLVPWTQHPSEASAAFLGGGFFNSAYPVINLYLFMLLAAPGETASFSGTFSTVTAPVVLIAPWAIGILAASAGFGVAFGLSAIVCLLALFILWRSNDFGAKPVGVTP